MFSICLLAQAKPAGSPFDRPEIILGTAGLAGALLVGAFVIFLVDRWRKRSAMADLADAGSELTNFRAMYERGEITEEEYNRLRLKVSERVKTAPEGASGVARANGAPPPPESPARPFIPGPLPPEYFEDPRSPDQRDGAAGERPPPA